MVDSGIGTPGIPPRSEGIEEHQDLVQGVVGREAEGPGPATDLTPSESAVEVLQTLFSPGSEIELFEPHVVAGYLPQLTHEGGADTAPAELGVGLKVVDRAPVPDEPVGIVVEDNPSGKNVVESGGDESAVLRWRRPRSLSATGATSLSWTGGKGNPAAPPELVTAIQQSISWRRSSGVTSRASVI